MSQKFHNLPENNYEDVWFRNVIVAVQSALYEKVHIWEIRDKQRTTIPIPFFYSMTGDEQFLMDYFLNTDRYCGDLSTKIEGNTGKVPRGVLKPSGADISSDSVVSKFERSVYKRTIASEFGKEVRTMSAATQWIPISMQFEANVMCSSDIMRMKVFQQIIRKFYKTIKIYMNFEGFSKIPVMIGFPESFDINKDFQFMHDADNKRPELGFAIEVLSYLPDVDYETERHTEEKMSDGINTNHTINDVPLDE